MYFCLSSFLEEYCQLFCKTSVQNRRCSKNIIVQKFMSIQLSYSSQSLSRLHPLSYRVLVTYEDELDFVISLELGMHING